MFKFMKIIKGQITSKTAPFECKPNARPNVKKTVSAPPVMKNIPKIPVGNGALPYNVTTVMTPNHGGDESAINELSEGQMDLDVILPDGKKERVTVERSTQMIDLLVKVTTPYKIKPGEHMIQVFDEGGRDLIYKPSTYIGFLDTNTIFVVPKKKPADNKKLTFEQTSRLQIRLPHNQRIAYRFGLKITLDEIKQTVCREKNFNPDLYHLAHPNQMDVAMDGNITFEDYNFKEISLVSSKSTDVISSQLESIKYPSHSDLVKKEETLSFGSNHSASVCSSSSGVLDNQKPSSITVRSKFKKGPAPPPPPQKGSRWETPLSDNTSTSKVDSYELDSISHSRHSSDSSGYHEPSILSDPPSIITVSRIEDFPNHKAISEEKASTPKENPNKEIGVRLSLTKSVSPSLSVGKKRKAPRPPIQSSCPKANGLVKNPNISQPLSTLMSESSGHLELSKAENCKSSDNKGLSEKHETNLKNTPLDPDNCCETNTSVFNTVQHNNIEPSDTGHSHTFLDYHSNELIRRDLDSCCSESDTEESEQIREDFDVHFVPDVHEGRSKESCIIEGSDKEADSAHLEPSSRDISDSFQVKKHKKTDTQQSGEILIEQKMEPPALLKEKVPRKATGQNNHSAVDENNVSFEENLNESLASDDTSQSTLPSDLSPPPLDVVSGETSVMRNHSENNSENTNSKLIKQNDLSITAAIRNLRLENFTIKPYMQEKEVLFSSELQNFKNAKNYLECNENLVRNYLEKPFLRVPDKENPQETESGKNRFQVHKSDSESETKPKLVGCEKSKPFQEETSPIIMTPQNNKMVFSGEGSVRGIKGKVRIRCLAIDDQNIFNGKTNSMMDLSQQTVKEADERYDDNQQTGFLERFRRTRSQVDVSQSSSDQELKLSDLQNGGSTELGIFKASSDQQNELQDEYQNLQNQLLSYQKKMTANQELLPKENIMSNLSLPPLTKSQVFFKEQLSSFDIEELKTKTLPKQKPCSVSAAKNIHNSTFSLQSSIHSASLTSAKTKQFDSFKNPIKKDLIHSSMIAESQPATDSEKPEVISHENEQETRKKTNDLISNKSPWLSQAETEDISLKRFYKQLKENSYKPANKANKQETIIGNVAYRTKSLNVGKESIYSKQDERFFKESISQNIEQPEVAQCFKNIFAPQPYKPISSTFRLPPAKILGAPVVRGFSEEAKSKILESVKSFSVKGTASRDTVADNSKEETSTNEEVALSPLRQNHVFQLQNTGVGTKSAKSFTDRVNTGAPIFPQTLLSQTNDISSTGNTQVNRFTSQNFYKEGSESKKLQNVDTREELLMEIKKFGGQNSLKKVPPRHSSWQLKVFGSSLTE